MSRYIDADRLVAWCMKTYQTQSTTAGIASVNAFLTAVDSCPPADVVEVRHGEWEKHGYKWRCSNCNAKINLDGTPRENGVYFCPNCGAKMDEKGKKKMRDRLTEIIKSSLIRHIDKSCRLAENIADDLLAKGVIVPPCKVGDLLYMPWEWSGHKGIACLKVTVLQNILDFGWDCGTDFNTDDEGYAEKYNFGRFKVEDFGKLVFLTRKEAEKALAERKENGT